LRMANNGGCKCLPGRWYCLRFANRRVTELWFPRQLTSCIAFWPVAMPRRSAQTLQKVEANMYNVQQDPVANVMETAPPVKFLNAACTWDPEIMETMSLLGCQDVVSGGGRGYRRELEDRSREIRWWSCGGGGEGFTRGRGPTLTWDLWHNDLRWPPMPGPRSRASHPTAPPVRHC